MHRSRKLRGFVRRRVKSNFTADSAAWLENLSLTGCFVRTGAALEIGQQISIALETPAGPEVTLAGRVAWGRPAPRGYGVMFDPPDEHVRWELALLIAESEEGGGGGSADA